MGGGADGDDFFGIRGLQNTLHLETVQPNVTFLIVQKCQT